MDGLTYNKKEIEQNLKEEAANEPTKKEKSEIRHQYLFLDEDLQVPFM